MAPLVFEVDSIDWDRAGVHFLRSPRSSAIVGAVVCGSAGRGRTVLCMADSIAGEIAVHRLLSDLSANELHGCVVLIPRLRSLEAGQTPDLDEWIATWIIPRVGVVVSLGGQVCSQQEHAWSSSFPQVADRGQWEEMAQVAAVFDAPFIVVTTPAAGSLEDQAAERGKTIVGGEFGLVDGSKGSGSIAACEGAKNVLKYYGMIEGDLVRLDPTRRFKPRVVAAKEWVAAPRGGLFESVIALGERVEAGQVIGKIRPDGDLSSPAVDLVAPHAGWLIGRAKAGRVQVGEPSLLLATDFRKA